MRPRHAFDQARDLAVQVSAEQTLKLVDDALERFDNGTYGLCLDCGQEIDAARLEAIPYAPLCLKLPIQTRTSLDVCSQSQRHGGTDRQAGVAGAAGTCCPGRVQR